MNGNWLEGWTRAGRHVRIPQDPYSLLTARGDGRNVDIFVDGIRVELAGRITRFRDGGTTVIPTVAGRIVRQTPMDPRGPHTLDGEPLFDRFTAP